MKRKTSLWLGVTLLAVLLFNYLAIGIPLYQRINSLDNKIRVWTKSSEDVFIIDVLKREAISIDKKIVILNCVAASVAIVITSWLIFGLIVHREERRKL